MQQPRKQPSPIVKYTAMAVGGVVGFVAVAALFAMLRGPSFHAFAGLALLSPDVKQQIGLTETQQAQLQPILTRYFSEQQQEMEKLLEKLLEEMLAKSRHLSIKEEHREERIAHAAEVGRRTREILEVLADKYGGEFAEILTSEQIDQVNDIADRFAFEPPRGWNAPADVIMPRRRM